MLWRTLHLRALSYLPMKGEEKWFEDFIESIPCPLCQDHFQLFIKQSPPDFSSRPAFFRWTVCAHNYVNRSLNKKEIDLKEALFYHFSIFEDE